MPRTQPVTVTYLHLPSAAAFRPAYSADPAIAVVEAQTPLVAFYRFLYDTVGYLYFWRDRHAWTDEQLYRHLTRPTVTLLVAYAQGTPAGFIELEREGYETGTEIDYFGLIPLFHGRGLGKHLLSVGVQRAFTDGAPRVYLNTCTLDGPHALANYQARGFVPYHSVTGQRELPEHVPVREVW